MPDPNFDKLVQDYKNKKTQEDRNRLSVYVAMARINALVEENFKNDGAVLPAGADAIPQDQIDQFFAEGTSIFPTKVSGRVFELDIDFADRLRALLEKITGNLAADLPRLKVLSGK
ncbi:MAG: hypothetical protein E5W91_32215 [Mesorhizobium sp.]|uniref:hypothetical protein n=1 Tax=Mesorhizobium sp. TaxID=1871066 RepID=UPI001226B29B|nr:hypothetical protein [Mesorhizobium sp.]TIS53157.1 MAG: hypothetical protein E5W91_32215 [Mesorhizobium sp.]